MGQGMGSFRKKVCQLFKFSTLQLERCKRKNITKEAI